MIFEGNLSKMKTDLLEGKVKYTLSIGDDSICMNEVIGHEISLKYQKQINCIKCGAKTKTSFAQGFCYRCFQTAPETEECVLRPELCRAHEGVARDMEYAKQSCLSDQYVYLAVSSGLKVGVTRHTQVPTRWLDQGASYALEFAKVPNRYTAGLIEVALKEHVSDKTNWQRMLKNQVVQGVDLFAERERMKALLPSSLQEYVLTGGDVTSIEYPVTKYPEKVKAVNFDKVDAYNGKLAGIKGQYLIFEDNAVINIRKYTGYLFQIEY